MIEFVDFGLDKESRLSFKERKDEPRFLDILNQLDIQKGDEVTIDIAIKHGDKKHHIQINKPIKHILNSSCDFKVFNESECEIKTDICKEIILD